MSPRGRTLTDAEAHELRREAQSRPVQESLRPWCEERAGLLGVHWSTIYRAVRDVRSAKRARRNDAGALRSMDQESFDILAALVVQFDYDAELAIDTLTADRVKRGLPPLEVHPDTLRRHLRQAGVSRRSNAQDLRVHRRWEAPTPGYLWQMDSTVAATWYIETDDTVGYEAPIHRNKNKAGNGRPRIWLIGAVDDHTRVRWARFYTGNDALAWRDLLIRAMRGFAEPGEWPAFGIPERIYTDQDSAMKSSALTSMLSVLGIERVLANPSTEHETNAQAKGKAERSLGVILHGFEKAFRGARVDSLTELNRLLVRYLVWRNNRVHSETGVAPFERWLTAASVRALPGEDLMRRLLRREVERVITSDLSIQLEGKTYQLPRRAPFVDFIKKKVAVLYYEADLSKITVVLGNDEHEVDAVEALPDVAGERKSGETPKAVELKRELLARDLSGLDRHAVFDLRTERDPRAYPIRPPVTVPPVTGFERVATIKKGKATDRAQREGAIGVPPTELERAAIEALFGERKEIPERELLEWIENRRRVRQRTDLRAEGA